MFERTVLKRMADWPGPLLLAVLVVAACDPQDADHLFDGHGGSKNPPSSGQADGGIGGKPTDPCAAATCATGNHCEAQAVECVKAPCPPVAVCVKNAPVTVSCGGFAGKRCPGVGKCVDDPTDCCNPAAGDADCIGLCACVQTVACVKGATFDSSPSVCACVPATPPPICGGPVCQIFCENGNVLDAGGCPTCKCNPPPTMEDPCATVLCKAGTHCAATVVECITAPCPPIASCVPDAPKVFCGGIAGIACAGSGTCVDDPADSCDPQKGGADCGGICQCVQKVLCVKGATFDSSPKVCACVATPPPPVCGPVCDIFCPYGHLLDANGCQLCGCNPAPTSPCPPEKCTGPRPASASIMCSDGKTVGGPACTVNAAGGCGWDVVTCPKTGV
jgi:Antistasin family